MSSRLFRLTIPTLAIICTLSISSRAQDSLDQHLNRHFSSSQLLADLDFVVSKLSVKEYGRDPFAYVDKGAFQEAVDGARRAITKADSMTLRQFFVLAGRIIALVKDDHASLQLSGYWARKAIQGNMFAEPILLPLTVAIRESTCVVIAASGIPVGSRLLSINAMPISGLIQLVLQSGSFSQLNALRTGCIEYFDFPKYAIELHALAGLKDSVLVRYVPPAQSNDVVKYIPLFRYFDKPAYAQSFQVVPFKKKPIRALRIMDSIAVISLNSFRIGKDSADTREWLAFFDTTFKSLADAKVSRLLIDVSENGGGSEFVGYILLNYLWSGKLKTTYYSDELPIDSLAKISVSSRVPGFRYGEYQWRPFHGKAYVLISERTFSSAARFVDLVKSYNIGMIIGRKTRAFRSHYGEMASAQLPNTSLPFTWSTKFFVSVSGDVKPHPIEPDVTIPITEPEDMVKILTEDLLLTKALDVIRTH